MSVTGLRQLVAAIAFRFCAWRGDRAMVRSEVWDDRARLCRQWGEDPVDRSHPF